MTAATSTHGAVGLGAGAGLAGGAALAVTACLISEIANEPTSVAGIDSSTWTPLTGITGVFFGADAVAGDFEVLPILFGLAVVAIYAAVLGAVGLALLTYVLGPLPGPAGAALFGLLFGVSAEILVVNVVVNNVQATPTVYHALPSWGWWVAHAAYGTTLGLVASGLLRTRLAERTA